MLSVVRFSQKEHHHEGIRRNTENSLRRTLVHGNVVWLDALGCSRNATIILSRILSVISVLSVVRFPLTTQPPTMRIAIGQLWQETNTFNPRPTTRRDYEDFGVLRGAELVERMAEVNELGAFIQTLRAWPERPEIVGLVRLPAWPSGLATRETFEWIQAEFLAALDAAGPVDAVLLALHGALVADGVPDVEGTILAAIRARIGRHTPLVATLDLHTNITQAMVDHADTLVIFHTAPHIDVFETGVRGANALRRIVIDGARPTTAFVKLPLVVPAERANTQDPMSASFHLRQQLEQCEQQPPVLAAGLATVQPWLDIPELGTSVLVTTDNDSALAQRLAQEIATQVWESREAYLPELTDLSTAVRAAHTAAGLTVISDSADATTSGAPGDSNQVLRELLKFDWDRQVLVPLVAPEVVEQSRLNGVGSTITAVLGGRYDPYSTPLTLPVRVERLFDGRFVISGHLAKNLPIDMGPCAVLRHASGVSLLITSRSGPHFAPEFFRAAGFDPFGPGVLIAKSPCGFRAAYQSRAQQIFVARVPGCARSDFWQLAYTQIPAGLWPWDRQRRWAP